MKQQSSVTEKVAPSDVSSRVALKNGNYLYLLLAVVFLITPRYPRAEEQLDPHLSTVKKFHIRESNRKRALGHDLKLESRLKSPVLEVEETDIPQENIPGICGTLLEFIGRVEILDSTRSHILDSGVNSGFACDSWISVRSGWALIKFRDGQKIRLGHETLVQLGGRDDQLVLYRGVAYVEADGGTGEFRLATAIGRARIKRGKLIFFYSPESDTTQLISLENSSTLENRFERGRRVEIQAGESSELNFKQLRVIPLLPASIDVSSLKIFLDQLQVPDYDNAQAIRVAIARHSRKFSTLRKEDRTNRTEDSDTEERAGGGRELASIGSSTKKIRDKLARINQPYLRHAPDSHDKKLNSHFVSRLTGGHPSTRGLVNPGHQGRGLAGHIASEEDQFNFHKLIPIEEAAKKQLIHVLSKIKSE